MPRGRPKKPVEPRAFVYIRTLWAAFLALYRDVQSRRPTYTPPAPPTRAQSIFARANTRELIATILLLIPSAGAMLLTYRGTLMVMAEQGTGINQKTEALMFALSVGILIWIGWYYLFGLVHHLRGRRLARALAAGGLYVTIVACIDAPFNMLALAGDKAIQMSFVDTAAFYEKARGDVSARIGLARSLVPGLKTQAERFTDSEKREVKGAETGSPKAGKVSAAYGQVGGLLGGLGSQLDRTLATADAIEKEITAALARMKTHVYRQGSMRAREQGVSTEADRIDELMGRLAQLDMAVSIRTTLRSLETAVQVPKTASKPFEVTQNEHLARIADQVRTLAGTLQKGLDELAAAPATKAEAVRPADPMTAIRTYWRPLLPQWLGALFVDLAPALLLFLLIAARREAEAAEEHDLREGALS